MYPHLLSPGTIGSLTLPHRVIMASMHTGLEDSRRHRAAWMAYLTERASAGLIVTGGFAPNRAGWLSPGSSSLVGPWQIPGHRRVTAAVHAAGGLIAAQLLHAGRYSYSPLAVGPSARKSRISRFTPRRMSATMIASTIEDFGKSAARAQAAGYDAVEIMGSEGYLINQFFAAATNDRTDAWGGDPQRRRRFAVEVVRAIRRRTGAGFPLIFRVSLADLVPDGQRWDDIEETARELQDAGVDAFSSGIGWHESTIPTIATQVPRAAWAPWAAKLRAAVDVPVIAINRINDPDVAERVIASGAADFVGMARPFLADPHLMEKVAARTPEAINTCIACNQACLDRTFTGQKVRCLVNPRAGQETVLPAPTMRGAARGRSVVVVGGGPAGLSAAVAAAESGHRVQVFEANAVLGGQFRYAMQIPGKEEFSQTLRYFAHRLDALDVQVHLGRAATVADCVGSDQVIVATGVAPRVPDLVGVGHDSVMTYAELLAGTRVAGKRVAVVGAGGVGVDVAQFLVSGAEGGRSRERVAGELAENAANVQGWMTRWGVGDGSTPGALAEARAHDPARQVYLLQRKTSRIGAGLGKTTGWIHRAELSAGRVERLVGVTYREVSDAGLAVSVEGRERVLEVDSVVLCAGQVSVRGLVGDLEAAGVAHQVVGGALVAGELDAERAIREGFMAAASL